MSNITIRRANKEDIQDIQNIYGYYTENTAISFEYETPTLEEFTKRFENISSKFPYLVAEMTQEQEKKIVGYAYGNTLITRAAYDYCAELTIYLDPEARKCGIGRKLYETLEEQLAEQGIKNLYACIGSPIEEDKYLTNNSEQFHQHLGFKRNGLFYKCGYKFGRWYNMIWMEKIIGEHR
jgi:phosphinothricin acetyltransferase